MENQDRSTRWRGWSRLRSFSSAVMSAAQAQSPTPADAATHAADARPDADGDQFDGVVGAALTNLGSNFLERLGNQSSNGFNRLQRTNPGGGGASESTEAPRYRTWFEGYGNSHEKRRDRRFRRRQPQDLGRRRRHRRAGGAGHQYRLFRRPEPLGDRHSAGAAIGHDRPDPARLHRLRRQRAVDLGNRGRARFRQHQLTPRHRLRACDRRLQCAARRRVERDQLLLDQGPGPHRAQGRVRICPRPDRFAAGDRRPRSGRWPRARPCSAHAC